MFDLSSIALVGAGAAGVGVAYFLYLAASKGVPAATAWVKAKWNAGKADLISLQGDVAGVQTKLASLETVALAEIQTRLASVEAAVTSLKAAPAPQPAPSAAPAPATA